MCSSDLARVAEDVIVIGVCGTEEADLPHIRWSHIGKTCQIHDLFSVNGATEGFPNFWIIEWGPGGVESDALKDLREKVDAFQFEEAMEVLEQFANEVGLKDQGKGRRT